ncbi:DUF6191 domain-containing protein [Actinoallomurus purpureus]|uniref:DUF6191 domain-containing protein n=1 Tax=Actinoallomurus purpureus TaxID=478114 RepID=UPI00209259AB|nr:DUF6191 domain-containing protein [Actinoallomurus purpureus]MCO6011642.1 DUF6191 domain-containing protein [Actinoallomurus purpureus]
MAAFAAALPVLACMLLALAGLERAWIRMTGHGLVPWLRRRSGTPLSATGFDEFTAAFQGSKRTELDHRQVERVLRDEDADGAPPANRVDLDQNVAYITKSNPDRDANQ